MSKNIGTVAIGRHGDPLFFFNTVTGVDDNTETDVLTYTPPTGKEAVILNCFSGGTVESEFKVVINTDIICLLRSSAAKRYVDPVFYTPLVVSSSDTLTIRVIHFDKRGTQDFEATIIGYLTEEI